jgi:hypothetical protein
MPKPTDESMMVGSGESTFNSQQTAKEKAAAMADPGPLGLGGGLGAGLGVQNAGTGSLGIEFTA